MTEQTLEFEIKKLALRPGDVLMVRCSGADGRDLERMAKTGLDLGVPIQILWVNDKWDAATVSPSEARRLIGLLQPIAAKATSGCHIHFLDEPRHGCPDCQRIAAVDSGLP